MISERAKRIEESTTLRINTMVNELTAAGEDVVNLSVGQPNFAIPEDVKKAVREAVDDPRYSRYTNTDGIPELKKAIIDKLRQDNQLDYAPDEVVVSCGAKHSIYNAMMAILNKGHEIIIPAPYWVSYTEMAELAEAKPVIVNTKEENGFRLTPKEFEDNINFATRAVIINNPCNPTGTGYSREELEALVDIAVKQKIWVIADEIYEKIVYDNFKFHSLASFSTEAKARTIVINGVSKSYAMTGWRIGYAAGPREVISAMKKLQGHMTSNPTAIAQAAALAALRCNPSEINKMVAEFQMRRNFLLQKFSQLREVSCYAPQGAFYLFPNMSAYYGREGKGVAVRNAYGLCHYLLKKYHLAMVPGDAFGAPNYVRLSYAASMEQLNEGMERLRDALESLRTTTHAKKKKLKNYFTNITKVVPTRSDIDEKLRDAIVAEADSAIPQDRYYEWNANINGIILQLKTNADHLYEFWQENWYPGLIESDIEPHGVIYAVTGVPGREPQAYYHPETKTGVIINTDYYAQVRNMALGMVSDISEKLFDVHVIRAFSLDYNGKGMLIIAPKGTGKSEHFYSLLELQGVRFHSNECVFARYRGGQSLADSFERKLYMPTEIVINYSQMARLFERCPCENVTMKKKYCANPKCRLPECLLDFGEPYCFFGDKSARSLLDPMWMGGEDKYTRRTNIGLVVLLRKERSAPAIVKLSAQEAADYVADGRYFDASSGAYREEPFFNPNILVNTPERLALQHRYFKRLFNATPCYLLNTEAGSFEGAQKTLRDLLKGM